MILTALSGQVLNGIRVCDYRFPFRKKHSKSKRSFADALAQFATLVRAFFDAQFFGQCLLSTGFADRSHGFDSESLWDFQLGFGAVVIEAFHPVYDETLTETLQSEIGPRGAAIIGMGDGFFAVVLKGRARNEED